METQGLKVGAPAPDFELTSDQGTRVKLSNYRGKRVIVYFYPKDDTPGCTTQACGFRDRYPVIEEKNAVILGISPDGMASHQQFKTKFNLPFTLLVDEDQADFAGEGAGLCQAGNAPVPGFGFEPVQRAEDP